MFLDILTSTIDLSEEGDSMNKLITDTINKVVIEIYALQAETEIQRKKKATLDSVFHTIVAQNGLGVERVSKMAKNHKLS